MLELVGHVDLGAPQQRGPETALALAIPSARRDLLDRQPSALDSPQVSPLIVTDTPDQFHGQQTIDEIMKAPADDLLGTAITVYRMLVATMSPDTYTCTDLGDMCSHALKQWCRHCQSTDAAVGGT